MRISLLLAVAAFVIMVKCHDRSDDADYEKPRRHHRHRHSRRTHGRKPILQDANVLDLLSEYSTLKKQLQRLERHLERNTLLNKNDWDSETSAQDYDFGDERGRAQDSKRMRHRNKLTANEEETTVVVPTTTTETSTTTQTTTEATTTSTVSNTPTTRMTTQMRDEDFTIPMKTTLRQNPVPEDDQDYSDLTLDTEKLELEQGSKIRSTDEPALAAESQTTDNRRENSGEPSQTRESTENKRKITWTYEPLSEPKMVGFPTVEGVGKVEDEVKHPAEPEKRLNREVHSSTKTAFENAKVSPDEDTVSMSEPLPTKEGFVPVVMGPDGPIVLPHYVINSKSAEDESDLNLNPTLDTSSINLATRRFKIEPPQAPPTAPRREPTYRRLTEAEFLERRRKEHQERQRLEKEGTERQRETSKFKELNGNSEENQKTEHENETKEIRNRQKASSTETEQAGGREEYVDYRPSGQKATQLPNYQTFSNARLAQMLHEFPELSSVFAGLAPWAGYNREANGAQFDIGGPGFQGAPGFMGDPGFGYNQGFPSGFAPRQQGRRAIASGQFGNGMVAVPPSSIDFEGIFDKKQ